MFYCLDIDGAFWTGIIGGTADTKLEILQLATETRPHLREDGAGGTWEELFSVAYSWCLDTQNSIRLLFADSLSYDVSVDRLNRVTVSTWSNNPRRI